MGMGLRARIVKKIPIFSEMAKIKSKTTLITKNWPFSSFQKYKKQLVKLSG
jgi:hypothetical protein